MRADLLRKRCLFTDNTEAPRECVPSDLACFKRTGEEKMKGEEGEEINTELARPTSTATN